MREVVLDTETTGLNPDQGDRIVEIGAIELINHIPTGKTFHRYLNPMIEVKCQRSPLKCMVYLRISYQINHYFPK